MSLRPADDSLLHDYVDGRLNADERRAFERELADSPDLRAEVDAYQELRALTLSTPLPEVPSGLAERIAQRIRVEAVGHEIPRRSRFLPPAWAAAAAVLLFVGLITWLPNRQPVSHFVDRTSGSDRNEAEPSQAPALVPKGEGDRQDFAMEEADVIRKGIGEAKKQLDDVYAKKLDADKDVPLTALNPGAKPVPTSDAPIPGVVLRLAPDVTVRDTPVTSVMSIELVGEEDVLRFNELCKKAGFNSNLSVELHFPGLGAGVPEISGDASHPSDEKLKAAEGMPPARQWGAPAPKDDEAKNQTGGGGGGTTSRAAGGDRPTPEGTRPPAELVEGRDAPRPALKDADELPMGNKLPKLSDGIATRDRKAFSRNPATPPRVVELDVPISIVAALRESYGSRLTTEVPKPAPASPSPVSAGRRGARGAASKPTLSEPSSPGGTVESARSKVSAGNPATGLGGGASPRDGIAGPGPKGNASGLLGGVAAADSRSAERLLRIRVVIRP